MKETELRIGNYVNDGDGYQNIVESISEDIITIRSGVTSVVYFREPINELYPIPITEEWLQMLGFDKYETDKSVNYNKDGFRFTYTHSGKFKGKVFFNIFNVLTTDKVQYIHQLQNLYFALIGEELNKTK